MIELRKHDFYRGISQKLTYNKCQHFVITKPAGQVKSMDLARVIIL
jgi:hypothetical protein